MGRTAVDLDVPIAVPPGPGGFSARLANAVVDLIRERVLRPGQRLPGTRTLADRLGVTRGTVASAYDLLAAAGYVHARRGSGTVIAADAATAALAGITDSPPATAGPLTGDRRGSPSGVAHPGEPDVHSGPACGQPDVRWDLTPGRPDTSLIDPRAWRRAWRYAADEPIWPIQGGPAAHPALREALADQLRRARALVVPPTEIFVVPGASSALRALATALDVRGHPATVEDPGYEAARVVLHDAGAELRPVPVDQDGLIVDALPQSARLAYVTPSHQYPLGGRLSVGRRAELLRWAHRAGAVVLEDDYDGEFRYDVPPLPALASLAGGREHVAYMGTFSKTLAPELRVAWLVPPPWLRTRLETALERSEEEVPRMVAAALTRLLADGAVAAHLVRARRRYAARRNALVTAVRQHCPGLPILGVEAGLHVVLRLPDAVDDAQLSESLLEAGIRVPPLSDYSAGDTLATGHGAGQRSGPRGLVCGYARLPESEAEAVARVLARALAGSWNGAGRFDHLGQVDVSGPLVETSA